MAHSGIDLSALTPDPVLDLLQQAGVVDGGGEQHHRAGEVRFGGGRWEGHDQWGNPVQQSPGSPPTNSNTGQEVSPNDVTWNH